MIDDALIVKPVPDAEDKLPTDNEYDPALPTLNAYEELPLNVVVIGPALTVVTNPPAPLAVRDIVPLFTTADTPAENETTDVAPNAVVLEAMPPPTYNPFWPIVLPALSCTVEVLPYDTAEKLLCPDVTTVPFVVGAVPTDTEWFPASCAENKKLNGNKKNQINQSRSTFSHESNDQPKTHTPPYAYARIHLHTLSIVAHKLTPHPHTHSHTHARANKRTTTTTHSHTHNHINKNEKRPNTHKCAL